MQQIWIPSGFWVIETGPASTHLHQVVKFLSSTSVFQWQLCSRFLYIFKLNGWQKVSLVRGICSDLLTTQTLIGNHEVKFILLWRDKARLQIQGTKIGYKRKLVTEGTDSLVHISQMSYFGGRERRWKNLSLETLEKEPPVRLLYYDTVPAVERDLQAN